MLDEKVGLKYKKETIRQELGKNYIIFNDSLKKHLDPKYMFIIDEPLQYNFINPSNSVIDMVKLAFKKLFDTQIANQINSMGENLNQLIENYQKGK